MVRIDWRAAVGGTAEALACVPGLAANTLAQWQARDRLGRRGAGKGRPMVWHANDVLEIATRAEVSRLGLLPHHVAAVWAVVRGVMLGRQFPAPGQPPDPALLLAVKPDGKVEIRLFAETAPDDDPQWGAGMGRDDAPDTLLLVRTGRLVDHVAARIAAVAPHAVAKDAAP